MTGTIIFLTSLLFSQNALADFKSSEVIKRERLGDFEVLLTRSNELWIRNSLSEAERYVKYGFTTVDRNEESQIRGGYVGLFQFDGNIYAVGKEADRHYIFVVHDTRSEAFDPSTSSSMVLDVGKNILGLSTYLTVTYVAAQSESTSFLVPFGVLGASVLALGSFYTVEMKRDDLRAHAMSYRLSQAFKNARPIKAEKVDHLAGWSAENIRMVPSRGKARLFSTWIGKLKCESALRGIGFFNPFSN